ncbi:PAS domain-containing sensor histidine kinase [Occallatibacter savannae]|uniref:PAS domain-containing sensor histidine kinase n=1 Tax=Occallatibacter savannae TaxID=1002691 RepID=UPI000D68A9B9|nr:PAS domain S-box protein [Occallatibacter savannae]
MHSRDLQSERVIEEMESLRTRLAETEEKLSEAHDLISAIRSGEVDAVVVSGPKGEQVFTLRGAEHAYRALVEAINEGAATLTLDGTILYCNQHLADLMSLSLEQMIGQRFVNLLDPSAVDTMEALARRALNGTPVKAEIELRSGGQLIPVQLSVNEMRMDGPIALCMIVTDLTETKKWERMVSEGKLASSILESSAEAIAVCDETGRIIASNAALKRLCECNPQFEHFDQAFSLTTTEGDPAEEFSVISALNASIRAKEVQLRLSDGTVCTLLLSSGRIKAASSVAGCVLTLTDITHRKRVEQALVENEQRLRLAQQAAAIGTFEWDLRTNENRWTPELEAMYGLDPGTFGRTQNDFEQLVHPEDRSKVLEDVNLALRTGVPAQAEWRTTWPDGSIHWILGRWQTFKDESGVPARVAGINIDITSRKTAEEARRHLAAIVESSDDAIASKDLHGIVTSWNPGAERLFGYSAQEMIGQPIRQIIPPELQEEEDRILATIARGERIEHFETVRLAKDGRRIDVELTISPIRDEAGQIFGASKIVRDITQKKQTEHALRMTERLASVGKLAATVAHEINNPLEAVTNLLYLARSSSDPKMIQSLLAQADEELGRVALLSKQTLGFYREKSGAKPLRIGNIVEPLVTAFASKARNRSIDLRVEIRSDPTILAIEGEIRQVIANLLSNSIDAIFGGGTIRVRVSAGHAWDETSRSGVRMTIADSGSGIAPEHRSKLFEPFFTTNKDVGTGLGLWIAKGIVERHNGTLRFKSSRVPGKSGTAFTVFLPGDVKPKLVES